MVRKEGPLVLLEIIASPSSLHATTFRSPTEVKFQVPMEGCNRKEQIEKCGVKRKCSGSPGVQEVILDCMVHGEFLVLGSLLTSCLFKILGMLYSHRNIVLSF